jgi:hypothetical protein
LFFLGGSPIARENPKNAIKKVEEQLAFLTLKFLSISPETVFDMERRVKCKDVFCGVFELPLPRNARNFTHKKSHTKKWAGGWMGLGFSK